MPWPFVWFSYKGPHSKEVDKLINQISKDEESEKFDTIGVKVKPIKRKAESDPFDPVDEINRLFDFLISFVTCIIIVLLACKYMCVVLAPNNTLDDCQPSIYDLYVGIGALITLITIRLIKIFKEKKHGH